MRATDGGRSCGCDRVISSFVTLLSLLLSLRATRVVLLTDRETSVAVNIVKLHVRCSGATVVPAR